MTAVHHVGITVSDIDRSLAFYADLLQGQALGPWDRSGPGVDKVTGYTGVVVRQAFALSANGDTAVELLQYIGGSDVVLDPNNGYVGAVHVAIVVADLDGTLAELRARGVQAVSDPVVTNAPMRNFKAVYVLDPDGVRVELVEPPVGVTPWVQVAHPQG